MRFFELFNKAAVFMYLFVTPVLLFSSEAPNPSYRVTLRVEPNLNRIEVQAVINHPPTNRFYLHEDLDIKEVVSRGKKIDFTREYSEDVAPYTDHGRPVQLKVIELEELMLEYAGTLAEVEKSVNMVRPKLIELAHYASWYPIFAGFPDFTFELVVDVPNDYITTTNGRELESQHRQGRHISHWESYAPISDIVVVSSPVLQVTKVQSERLELEVIYSKLDTAFINNKSAQLSRAMDELSRLYGQSTVKGFLRFVYSPREGWGYSRIPMFVVSEAQTQRRQEQEFGVDEDLHGAVHELSHFWWRIADTSGPNDWLNEGLAEYSSFRLSGLLSGSAFQDKLLDRYRTHARDEPGDIAIAETPTDSKMRYVNRYERTTLMFHTAGNRFGQDHLDALLRALYSRFSGDKGATTVLFLEMAEQHIGNKAKDFFSKCLLEPWSTSVLE